MHAPSLHAGEPTQTQLLPKLVAAVRSRFEAGQSRPLAWRLRQLDGLLAMIEARESELHQALAQDLGKPALEAYGAETSFVAKELRHARAHLETWLKPEKVKTPLLTQPGQSFIQREPLGVALIIAPWNYPFHLSIAPLVGALAAGNCAVLKPSELAPATASALARLLPQYVDPECIKVVLGGVPQTTVLLEQRFDHIFYTGNGRVARIVMSAAAKHLTPVTLELGGKSPCIVDETTDLEIAARRIVLGKFYNAGQTCVAPDYVLAQEPIYERLLSQLSQTVLEFYGAAPERSQDYGRIISAHHHQRLMRLLEGQDIVCGGQGSEPERFIAPTILRDTDPSAPVMGEEIFGPILPTLRVRDMDEAIDFINARPKPLALYLFSSSARAHEEVLSRTSSGGVTINHVWMHLAVPDLPFGGVQESGMGAYHGRASFETFSHRRAVLKKPIQLDPPLLYPPYTPVKKRWLKRLL